MPTRIDWADEVWNPVTGCTKVSAGCANCYAHRMAHRLAGRVGYPADDPFRVTLHPDRLTKPERWKKPRRIFVCSMGDLFHEDVPDEFIERVLRVTYTSPHTYMLLTKRPERLRTLDAELYLCSTGMCVGTSVENNDTLSRVDDLNSYGYYYDDSTRFVSFEPLLGRIDLTRLYGVQWVIAGCESINGRPGRHADPDWFREIRDWCAANDVPFFLKQMEVDGQLVHAPFLDGRQHLEFPKGA